MKTQVALCFFLIFFFLKGSDDLLLFLETIKFNTGQKEKEYVCK